MPWEAEPYTLVHVTRRPAGCWGEPPVPRTLPAQWLFLARRPKGPASHEDELGMWRLSLEPAQRPELVALQRVN
jgi:hypothetical protein